MSPELREHIRDTALYALNARKGTIAHDSTTAVLQWLDKTEADPPGPGTIPVRIVVDVGPMPENLHDPRHWQAGGYAGRPVRDCPEGYERTIVTANVDVPSAPREVVGVAEST